MTENKTNAVPESTDRQSHLIHLIMNQDHVSQEWTKLFFTLEAAIAAAFGFILGVTGDRSSVLGQWSIVLMFPILVVGVLAAIFVPRIIVRERNWQDWYVDSFNAPGDRKVFPDDKDKEWWSKREPGYISNQIKWFARIIIVAWVLVLILVISIFFLSGKYKASAASKQGNHRTLTFSVEADYVQQ